MQTLENKIDAFQRRLLRKIIHVRWPRTISNQRLYERAEYQPCSNIVMRRRLTWFGHLLHLPADVPAQKALQEFIKPASRPVGRPKTTCIDTVIKNIKDNSNIQLIHQHTSNIDTLKVLCSDRKARRKAVLSFFFFFAFSPLNHYETGFVFD